MLRRSLSKTCRRSLSTTVDKSEVSKFSAVGDDWWDKSSKSGTGPLHAMNPVRVGYIRKALATTRGTTGLPAVDQIRGMKVLDVGCGGGLLAEALSRLGAEVTAIDPSSENIAIAKAHSSHDKATASIQYEQSTIEEVAASGRRFDAICALEVVEHVQEVELFLSSCAACLGNKGNFFLSTINRTPASYAMAIVGAEKLLRILPEGTHDWNKFPTPEEMRTTLAHCSLYVEDVSGLLYQPWRSVQWEVSADNTEVNYILHAIKAGP